MPRPRATVFPWGWRDDAAVTTRPRSQLKVQSAPRKSTLAVEQRIAKRTSGQERKTEDRPDKEHQMSVRSGALPLHSVDPGKLWFRGVLDLSPSAVPLNNDNSLVKIRVLLGSWENAFPAVLGSGSSSDKFRTLQDKAIQCLKEQNTGKPFEHGGQWFAPAGPLGNRGFCTHLQLLAWLDEDVIGHSFSKPAHMRDVIGPVLTESFDAIKAWATSSPSRAGMNTSLIPRLEALIQSKSSKDTILYYDSKVYLYDATPTWATNVKDPRLLERFYPMKVPRGSWRGAFKYALKKDGIDKSTFWKEVILQLGRGPVPTSNFPLESPSLISMKGNKKVHYFVYYNLPTGQILGWVDSVDPTQL
jgi:hypothetical protein